MASTIVGRTTCPECGFGAAHVKRSSKALYRYCPEPTCGAQYFPRNDHAEARLLAVTRPVKAAGTATATATTTASAPSLPAAPAPAATGSGASDSAAPDGSATATSPTPPPPAPRKRVGIF